jgi:hypothetical protein
LFYPLLTQSTKAECGLKRVVVFFCPWGCYEDHPKEKGREWLSQFADIARHLKSEASRGMKIKFEICADWDNANAQANSRSSEAQSGNTRTWKQAVDSFATVLSERGLFVDCSAGFWRERRSMHTSKPHLSQATFCNVVARVLVREACLAVMLTRVMSQQEVRSWSVDEVSVAQASLDPAQPAVRFSLAVPVGVARVETSEMTETPKATHGPVPVYTCSQELVARTNEAEREELAPKATWFTSEELPARICCVGKGANTREISVVCERAPPLIIDCGGERELPHAPARNPTLHCTLRAVREREESQ